MKYLVILIKNFILSACVLYGYNLIAVNFNMVIPINIFSILFVAILKAPALVGLILFKILVL